MYKTGHQEKVCIQNKSPEERAYVAIKYAKKAPHEGINLQNRPYKVTRVKNRSRSDGT